MKIVPKNLMRFGAVGVLALVFAVTGCKSGDRSAGQTMSDSRTAHRVKEALEDAPLFKYPDVKVTVYKGTARLSGFVGTQQQREEAAQLASRVKGVNQVINEIGVRPMPAGRATIVDPLSGKETGRIEQPNPGSQEQQENQPNQQNQNNSSQ